MIILKTINSLKNKDKRIALLSFFGELSDRKISKKLNIPQTTVSYRKRKIQKILQDRITKYCPYDDLFS